MLMTSARACVCGWILSSGTLSRFIVHSDSVQPRRDGQRGVPTRFLTQIALKKGGAKQKCGITTTAALSGRGEAVSYREEAILPSLLSSKTLKTTYNQQ